MAKALLSNVTGGDELFGQIAQVGAKRAAGGGEAPQRGGEIEVGAQLAVGQRRQTRR